MKRNVRALETKLLQLEQRVKALECSTSTGKATSSAPGSSPIFLAAIEVPRPHSDVRTAASYEVPQTTGGGYRGWDPDDFYL